MRIGIVGLGLIGGSIGLTFRGPGREIIGHDPSPEAADLAQKRFCVDRLAAIEEVAQSDFVFIACPPSKIRAVLDLVDAGKGPETIFTDCTSVKAEAVAWAREKKSKFFIPGHPMAGHEKSGAGFASAWMFRNAKWILTPVASTSKSSVQKLERLLKEIPAIPIRLDPEVHDRHVAIVSHLPHVFAAELFVLGETLAHTEANGGSWKDVTRVAGVDAGLWSEIFLGNSTEIDKALEETMKRLTSLRSALQAQDLPAVRQYFQEVVDLKNAK